MTHNSVLVLILMLSGLFAASGASRSPFGDVSLHFEPTPGSEFVARAGNYAVRVTAGGASISVPGSSTQLRWLGANPDAGMYPEEMLPGKSHYFLGDDPAGWRSGVANYRRVRVAGIYEGIDAVYYGRGNTLEFDLELQPGAKPEAVRFCLPGASPQADGALAIALPGGELRQLEPVVYQFIEGERRLVQARYLPLGDSEFGFEIEAYEPGVPLVIDPVLLYSTYIGGSQLDIVHDITVNGKGEVLVTGESYSPDFPVDSFEAGPKTGNPPGNVFVLKLNAAGDGILWSAFFGGSGRDAGYGLSVSVDGFTHITGYTQSADFPTTGSAAQGEIGDGEAPLGDAFVVRLAPGGDTLMYSSFLGGSGRDEGRGIALGPSSDMFVTGVTESSDFPVSDRAYQDRIGADVGTDAFVTRLASAGPEILYSTYIGGASNDAASAITLDSMGYAYITGFTLSDDFPTRSAFQPAYSGGEQFNWADAFVTKLTLDGTGLVFSTYLGGTRHDSGHSIKLDRSSHIYIAGETTSTSFPTTPGAIQPVHGDGAAASDAFVTKLDRSGTKLAWSTYFGGNRADIAHALAVTPAGQVTIAGETDSSNLPTGDADCDLSFPAGGRDAFVARIREGGAELTFAAYLGGNGTDRAYGVGFDIAGNAYLGGQTESLGYFPITDGALRSTLEQAEGFVAKISPGDAGDPRCISALGIVNAAGYQYGAVSPGEIIVVFGKNIGPDDLIPGRISNNKFTTDVAQTQVFFGERAAPIIYVQKSQLSVVVPYQIVAQPTINVRVKRLGGLSNTVELPVARSLPAIFSLDSSGQGQGAVLHPDYSVNGPLNPMDRGGIVILYTTGEGETDPAGVDGQLATGVYPKPRLPVSVLIGGVEAEVLYAGAAPGLVAGVMQVNVYVPKSIQPGDAVPVVLRVGNRASPPGITIAVR
jgi:uncharacterized protein (TIGR03437 family)